ncbi:MAG: oxygen-independent coproporphyrinogen III oxidase [Pseudomonadota bacterium]
MKNIDQYRAMKVPRYTSYPTAIEFSDEVGETEHRGWLAALDNEQYSSPISLYLHVPYCKQLCWYCGCHAQVNNRAATISRMANRLAAEAALVDQTLGGVHEVSSVHFGGGTPTTLSSDDFDLVMSALRTLFAFTVDCTVSVEIDPRTLTEQKALRLGKAGVNRVSLGVQDFARNVQTSINRVQPYVQVAEAVDWLRLGGVEKISFDLMYGLPNQTTSSVIATAMKAITLNPDRLSVFGYAHLPQMLKHQRLIDEDTLPQTGERWEQAEAIAACVEGAGYVPIGFDHFARLDDPIAIAAASGGLSRNFQGFTADEVGVLIAFGPSAISSLPQGFVQNEKSIQGYEEAIAAGRLPSVRGVKLSKEDRVRGAIIRDLLCNFSCDVGTRAREYGFALSVFQQAFDQLVPLVDDGLAVIEGNRVYIPKDARRLARVVACCFDGYRTLATARGSLAV